MLAAQEVFLKTGRILEKINILLVLIYPYSLQVRIRGLEAKSNCNNTLWLSPPRLELQ